MQWSAVKIEEGSVFAIKKELVERLVRLNWRMRLNLRSGLVKQAKTIAEAWEKVQKDTSTKDLGRRATNGVLGMIAAALNDAMKLNVGIGENLINEDQERQIDELASKNTTADMAAAGIAARL